MKTHKTNIINDPFEGRPTRFGKVVVEAAKHEDDWAYWEEFYNTFLNREFWVPVVVKDKGTKKESYYPVLSVQKNGEENLIIFEKKSRAAAWHKSTKKKVEGEVYVAKFESGYSIIKTWPLAMFKQYNLYIDFGKSTCFIFSPERSLWLRKRAIELEK